jgi:DNA-binding transcriptional LysR family regulator
VERTSRRVSLTDAGMQLRDDLAGPFASISQVLETTFTRFSDTRSILRVGLYNAGSGGTHFAAIVAAFERQGPCDVEIVELPFNNRVGPLRSGEIDIMAIRLPVEQPEITVGPILSCEPRVLGVARDHPLVGKGQVSIEDLADYAVGRFEVLMPAELVEAITPRTTPRGRTIPRRRDAIRSTSELLLNIASGRIVHPTVASFGLYLSHPEIVYLPIIDMPDSEGGRWPRLFRRRRSACCRDVAGARRCQAA